LYLQKEIDTDLSFFTREYVLEYLSKGLCICGKNIFKNKFEKIIETEYQKSILIRSTEHTQMVRKVFFSNIYSNEYKLKYIKKYILRLSVNILLFYKIKPYAELSILPYLEVMRLMKENLFIESEVVKLDSLKESFGVFCIISSNLVGARFKLEDSSLSD